MVCHILCPECSEDLGAVYLFYKKVVDGYYVEKYVSDNKNNVHIDKLDLKKDFIENFGFIFDALEITHMCCVMHMLGSLEFESNYY